MLNSRGSFLTDRNPSCYFRSIGDERSAILLCNIMEFPSPKIRTWRLSLYLVFASYYVWITFFSTVGKSLVQLLINF